MADGRWPMADGRLQKTDYHRGWKLPKVAFLLSGIATANTVRTFLIAQTLAEHCFFLLC